MLSVTSHKSKRDGQVRYRACAGQVYTWHGTRTEAWRAGMARAGLRRHLDIMHQG